MPEEVTDGQVDRAPDDEAMLHVRQRVLPVSGARALPLLHPHRRRTRGQPVRGGGPLSAGLLPAGGVMTLVRCAGGPLDGGIT
jgi:hypothetical protein